MPITPDDIHKLDDGEKVSGVKGTCKWCGGTFIGKAGAEHCSDNHAAYTRQGRAKPKAPQSAEAKARKVAAKIKKLAESIEAM